MRALTPVELVAELDRHIVGQASAKRAVAMALRNRWRAQRAGIPATDTGRRFRYVVGGPRGVGKSGLIRLAAEISEAPFVSVSAYQLASASSTERAERDVLEMLLEHATCLAPAHNPELALNEMSRSGIILIDDLDRWQDASSEDGQDEAQSLIQRAIAGLVTTPYFRLRNGRLDTRHLLIFVTGQVTEGRPADLPRDLQTLFPGRIELDALDEDNLRLILANPVSSPAGDFVALLATEGLSLQFTDDALDAIASEAAAQNRRIQDIGARRLILVIETVLDDVLYDPPSNRQPELVIDASYVSGQMAVDDEEEDLDDFIL